MAAIRPAILPQDGSELFRLGHLTARLHRRPGDNYAVTFGACLKWVRSLLADPPPDIVNEARFLFRYLGCSLAECVVLRASAASLGACVERLGTLPEFADFKLVAEPRTALPQHRGTLVGNEHTDGDFDLLGGTDAA